MAYAKKCDRCGAFYNTHVVPTKGYVKGGKLDRIRTITAATSIDEEFDLCNNCWVDFEKFMNNE